MSISIAKACFAENIQHTNIKTQPNEYNLYKGLYNLAAAIEHVESVLSAIQYDVAQLKRTQ